MENLSNYYREIAFETDEDLKKWYKIYDADNTDKTYIPEAVYGYYALRAEIIRRQNIKEETFRDFLA